MLNRWSRNEILKCWNLLLLYLWLINEWSESTRHWHLWRCRWFFRHLLNANILTLSFHLHFLLKFVLLSVFFKLLFIKSLWKIDRLFFLGFNSCSSLNLLLFFFERLCFNWFRFLLLNWLRFLFFNSVLDFLFGHFRLACNWLSYYNFGRLSIKKCTPTICWLLLSLLRPLLEQFSVVILLVRRDCSFLLREKFLLSHDDWLAFGLASFFTHFN